MWNITVGDGATRPLASEVVEGMHRLGSTLSKDQASKANKTNAEIRLGHPAGVEPGYPAFVELGIRYTISKGDFRE